MTFKPAIVHINTSLNARSFPRDAMLLVIAWLARRRVVWQVHGGQWIADLEQHNPVAFGMLKLFLKLPRRVVVICSQDELGYGKLVALNRLRRISNAVSLIDPMTNNVQERYAGTLRIIYIGRLVAGKGVLDLLDAIRIIARDRQGPAVALDIAGSGPLEQELRLKVHEYDLGMHVRLLGQVRGVQKHQLLSESDLLVLPSCLPERSPYALLESMAAGVPAIACATGGVMDVIEHRQNGMLVPPHRPDLLAAAIIEVARDRQLLRRMSVAARGTIVQAYHVSNMATRFCELYEEVIDE